MADSLTLTLSSEAVARFQEQAQLNEKQSRIFWGMLATEIGRGGRQSVAAAFKVGLNTVTAGKAEFTGTKELDSANDRVRRPGAGRKTIIEKYPEIIEKVQKLLENRSYGDPQRVLLWTTLSFRTISAYLEKEGYIVGKSTIGTILDKLGYSRQQNQKMLQVGEPHPDRDAQFRFIEKTTNLFLSAGDPVISVDCKKKELLGNFKNNGSEYRKKGDPRKVLDHDFEIKELGKVAPYGVYVLNNNTGFVNLTKCSDTSEFAVESIRAWWKYYGISNFPNSKKILINCDCGGSNGYRVRLWKEQLALLSEETGLEITVCHFPPGTSKWNKIEHRMFGYISNNWAGKPLISIETVVNYISNTKTTTGFKINCRVDERQYQKGLKVSDECMKSIDLIPLGEFEKWNYTVRGFKQTTAKTN